MTVKFSPTAAEAHKMAWGLAGSVFIGGLALLTALYQRVVFDKILPAGPAGEASLTAVTAVALTACVIGFAFRIWRTRLQETAAEMADDRVSDAIYRRLLSISMSSMPRSHAASAVWREHEAVREMYSSAVIFTAVDIAVAIAAIALIAGLAGSVALVPLAAGALLLIASAAIGAAMARATETHIRTSTDRQRLLQESVHGIVDVKLAGAEAHFADRMQAATEQSSAHAAKLRRLGALGGSLAALASGASVILTVAIGAGSALTGETTMGVIFAVSLLVGRAIEPFLSVSAILLKAARAGAARKALTPIVDAETETAEGRLDFDATRGELSFSDVMFRYPDTDRDVLSGLSLTVAPGERVAVLGPRGAGKSTLWRLAAGLYATDGGTVTLDGVNVKTVAVGSLRRHIGVLPQHAALFSGTLLDNVRVARPTATDEEVRRACEIAGVLDWLAAHQRGFGLQIVEQGQNLSGGERQSVALARLILADPKIVILDEPTGNLDPTSAQTLMRRLDGWLAGRTLLVITHRTEPLAIVNRAVRLEAGRVVEKFVGVAVRRGDGVGRSLVPESVARCLGPHPTDAEIQEALRQNQAQAA